MSQRWQEPALRCQDCADVPTLRQDVDNLLADQAELKRQLGLLRSRVDWSEMAPAGSR